MTWFVGALVAVTLLIALAAVIPVRTREFASRAAPVPGTRDAYTSLDESRALFERARDPKEFWAVEGARHEDLHAFASRRYEQRVGEFLAMHLGRR